MAEAIKDALAALDRKDYATAQGLFEALGQKGAAAAQVKGSTPASPAAPSPRHRQGFQWRPTPGMNPDGNP